MVPLLYPPHRFPRFYRWFPVLPHTGGRDYVYLLACYLHTATVLVEGTLHIHTHPHFSRRDQCLDFSSFFTLLQTTTPALLLCIPIAVELPHACRPWRTGHLLAEQGSSYSLTPCPTQPFPCPCGCLHLPDTCLLLPCQLPCHHSLQTLLLDFHTFPRSPTITITTGFLVIPTGLDGKGNVGLDLPVLQLYRRPWIHTYPPYLPYTAFCWKGGSFFISWLAFPLYFTLPKPSYAPNLFQPLLLPSCSCHGWTLPQFLLQFTSLYCRGRSAC